MRSTWSGAISLGLLTVPVDLFTGTIDEKIGFRQMCPKHKCPIQQRTFCLTGGEPVERGDLVKGFEVEPGKFVILTEDDLARAALPLGKVLEIEVCVPEAEIDPRTFHSAYIALPPKKDPRRNYALIHETLAKTAHVGVGRIALRTKQHIAAVRVIGPYLAVHLMHWPNELRPLDAYALPPAVTPKPAEVALAEQLVAAYAGRYDAATFIDQHRENVMQLIIARARGEAEVTFEEPEERADSGADIMALLEASITAGRNRKAA